MNYKVQKNLFHHTSSLLKGVCPDSTVEVLCWCQPQGHGSRRGSGQNLTVEEHPIHPVVKSSNILIIISLSLSCVISAVPHFPAFPVLISHHVIICSYCPPPPGCLRDGRRRRTVKGGLISSITTAGQPPGHVH